MEEGLKSEEKEIKPTFSMISSISTEDIAKFEKSVQTLVKRSSFYFKTPLKSSKFVSPRIFNNSPCFEIGGRPLTRIWNYYLLKFSMAQQFQFNRFLSLYVTVPHVGNVIKLTQHRRRVCSISLEETGNQFGLCEYWPNS